MSRDCRMSGCNDEARGDQPHLTAHQGKFCSPQCEVDFEHVRADAKESRAAAEAEADKESWP